MRNSRRGAVDPFIVMDVMEEARAAEAAGRSIIHMEVGQPGTAAPRGARAHLTEAMEASPLGYSVALGLPELRARIAQHYHDKHGVNLSPERVIITSGSSGAFILAFTALFEAGARVGLGEPGYPSYRQILKALDVKPVGLPTSAENRFQPVPSDFAGLELDGLLVASPANPSGTMLTREAMQALIDACAESETAFISDEIYQGIEYEGEAVSALELTDECYVINSFSKYFSMTGWRIGWMVVPEEHVRLIERLAQNMFICAPHASQVAALAAFGCTEELEANLAVYKANRDLMIVELPKVGLSNFAPPDGAFYIYVDVSHLTNDSRALASDILAKAGVAVTPGIDFDPERGQTTLRLSYARSTEEIREGLLRLKAYFDR
ncbi:MULTISPECIES: pyridoxal phosphate-dependent aminotransferase [Lentibacter]|jgi:aspartate/methionine/tyrosine aminotransferase|uniref:Aminotransferase n=1 Tax=Lentibacter algarum TaxID=576131 RepID=A0A1H3KBV8_9RHOB|nr:aminotransferase class I/II-fold pyridoxal phosphate-dependent enzyme [Lentibacter algarum]MCO4777429.1 aminotransferase class I/II-fold pyridoxal phosphate-dependent enzyme [Lentibacter algarum]MCO4828704.1 aminotransferase class I/II-fold pyridoxal phosphate-dependent enzyme [Lentibacter algarum]WIF32027.1 aminotransferase [Lentibacter algarum]SDY49651.1 Aspartate/methionine/tyrosine aminotransferase [Lentibacter algarum]